MKKGLCLLFVNILLLSSIMAQNIVFSHSFEMPAATENTDGQTVFSYKDCYTYGDEGQPLMPYYSAEILLPPGRELTAVRILSVSWYEETAESYISPAERQFPLSEDVENYEVVPDKNIYDSSQPFPLKAVRVEGTHFLQGHGIASFTICPMSYIPADSKVSFIKEISLEIETAETPHALAAMDFLRNTDETDRRIERIVENVEMQSAYQGKDNRDETDADILLITSEELMPAFQDYVAYKKSTGWAVSEITTEEIYNAYSGQDEQEQIRNCIIDNYQNNGISYVILGGDADPQNASDRIIPHRGFYSDAYGMDEYDIPSDLYYSCLDGNWNDDGDNKWGEAGEDDLYAELSIGRICVDNAGEIANFTNKLQMYQDAPVVADIEKALMVGELLWDDPTWGGDYKDEVAEGSSSQGYTTAGVSDNFTVARLYEKEANWEKPDIFDQFNNAGINLLNHLGHSNTNYNMKMYCSDITTTNFQNDGVSRGFVIGYSQGCYNGAFDNRGTSAGSYGDDSFCEDITTLETAEVANVGNSRYGWGQHSSTDGASQYFDRQFYDAIFGEDIWLIGDVNRDSKEDNVGYISSHQGAIRWCYYQTNLFGDPTLDIWTAAPTDIVATYPEGVSIGVSQIDFQTDAPYARIGLMQNGNLIGRGVADENGQASVYCFEPITQVDPIDVSIIAHNKNRHTGNIVIVTDEPYVIFKSFTINDQAGNGNGIAEPGESILLDMELKNVGSEPATMVTTLISSEDAFISITDNSEDYGDFDPDETKLIQGAYAIDIAADVPDQHMVSFMLSASGEAEWNSNFSLLLSAPELAIGRLTIDDAGASNPNGRLDPGETAIVMIETSNIGHAACAEAMASLESGTSYVTIENANYDLEGLEAEEEKIAYFTLTVDLSAPVGTVVPLDFQLEAGAYTAAKAFAEKIGLIIEDWESGSFDEFEWSFGGNANWTLVSNEVYEGTYAAKSGNISDSQHSDLILTYEVMGDDSISFFRKVSSEADYDYLEFYIDGSKKGQWAGEGDWERFAYAVDAGTHTFKWVFNKDVYVSGGQDCAWVDYISLPAPVVTTANAGPDQDICEGSDCQLQGIATNYQSMLWTSSGSGSFDDATIINPVYTPSQDDIDNGIVTITFSVEGDQTNLSDDMNITILHNPEGMAGPDMTVCSGTTALMEEAVANNYSDIRWTTTGDGSFDDIHILQTEYTPGENDITNGFVELVLGISNAPCAELNDTIMLTIAASPEPVIAGGQECCKHTIYSYSCEAHADNSYSWEITGGEIIEGQNTNQVEVIWSADESGIISVTETDSESLCQGSSEMTVNLLPTPEPMISGLNEICQEEQIIYNTNMVENCSWQWTVEGGEINSGQNTNEVEVLWHQDGLHQISVTETSIENGCAAENVMDVTIHELPLVFLGNDTSICHNHILTLNAGGNGEESFLWSTGENTQSITIDSTGVGIGGTKNISVTVTTPFGCSSDDEISVYFEDCSGISENESALGLDVYPNPNTGSFNLRLNPLNALEASVQIINPLSSEVVYEKVIRAEGFSVTEINVQELKKGIYFLIVSSDNAKAVKKLVVN